MFIPKIIAHRGANGFAPENTMAAFKLAMDHHADGFELDVQLTRDEQVVVIHDSTVDRTTNGTGRVKALTLADIQALNAGNGESVPSLAAVLEAFGGKCLINIELKNHNSLFDALPLAVSNLLNEYGLAKSVLISSFNPFNLPRLRRHCPEVKFGLLTVPNKARHWIWRLFRYDALHPHFSDVDQDLVSMVHDREREINVWTVDDPQEIRRLAGMKVDSVITNDPQKARAALEMAA